MHPFAIATLVAALTAAPTPTPSVLALPTSGTVLPSSGTVSPLPALPGYVRLGALEQAQVDRLVDEMVQADQLFAAGRLASVRVLLGRARREADAADRQLIVLKLYVAWTGPREHLSNSDRRLQEAWAKGPDPESRALVVSAQHTLDAALAPLERGALKLPPAEFERRMEAVREAFARADAGPLIHDNPAWLRPAAELTRRLEHLARLQALRAGQTVLADQIVRMVELNGSARARLAAADYDGALGDYAALEEACVTFKQDLAGLEVQGFDPSVIELAGAEGDRHGRTFLTQVDHWLLDAQRRDQLVAEARDPWRRAMAGDRLRVYGMYGVPTWPGAPATPEVADAVSQALWIFYEPVAGDPHVRLRHEYHFQGDHLQHHELFREQLP